jgi:diadenosine tetraphosphate (Ap4A) HIT family hydrolase
MESGAACAGSRILKDLPEMAACPFCDIPAERISVERDVGCAVGDLYPLSKGHTLVIPRRHVASIFALRPAEISALWGLVGVVREMLAGDLHPDGFNIGLNDGEAAGQTIAHAHVHVVPRYWGDVPDPRGGVRWVMPERATYWNRNG